MVHGIAGGVGVLLPASFGWSVASKATTGAVANIFLGANERGAIREILDHADYSQAAEQFDPTDPVALAIEGVTGGVFGAVAGKVSTKPSSTLVVSQEVADAARIREQIAANRENLPVDQNDESAVARGYEAQKTTHEQLNSKQSVNVPRDAYDEAKTDQIKRASAERLQKSLASGETVLQNRDRSTKASIVQMNSIAANPDYMRLRLSNSFTDGAPVVAYAADIPEVQRGNADVVVAADGRRYNVQYAVVEADQVLTSNNIDGSVNPGYGHGENITAIAGNGRAVGVKEAYARGTADKYRSELEVDQATGIEPSVYTGMSKPMLVRIMRDEDITADIGDITNRSATAQLSATEQAMTDAQRIDLASLQFNDDGSISPESVRQFASQLPAEERSRIVDSNGIPTQEAARRLDNAIFQQVYQNMALTDLLNTSEKTGVARMLSAFRQMAPSLLKLEGTDDLDFRPALTQILTEIHASRASGKGLTLEELAKQRDITRSPEAQVFLNFLAQNEANGGGVRGIVDAFSNLASFARANFDMGQQGIDLFGETPKPTKLDLMREFARKTGVEITEADFVPVKKLADVVEKKRVEDSGKVVQQAVREMAEPPIMPAPKMELITVGQGGDGVEHRVWGVNGNPDLTVFPEGVDGIKALPLRLQETTLANGHMDKHLPDLQRSGYESIEQAVWDVAHNYTQIYKGKKEGQLVLTRPIAIEEKETVRKGLLMAEFQEVAGVYRVGSVLASDNERYLKNRRLLWDKSPPNRLHSQELLQARTRGLTGPQQPSDENIIGQKVANVNDIKRVSETVSKAKDIGIARQSIETLKSAEDTQMHREAMTALDADPSMRVQLDDKDYSASAAEYLQKEIDSADAKAREADQGAPVAVVCAVLNGGLDGK